MFRTPLSLFILLAFLLLPVHGAAQSKSGTPAQQAQSSVVNINSASVVELQTLPGIGQKTAELIVEYRQKNGPFKKVEELMNIRGIGEKNFLKLKPQITIAPARSERTPQQ